MFPINYQVKTLTAFSSLLCVKILISTLFLPGYQDSELRYLTFLYTCPLTVLWGAEQAGLANGPIQEATSLIIHLVGARTAEIRHLVGWEIIALR